MADIGPYRIVSLISEGTQALSYRAVHTGLEREVFLKVLPGGGPAGEESRARFEREAKALAKIDHPAVVRVYDFGVADGRLYIASEYVDGPDLAHRLRQGPIPWAELRETALALLEGLHALHDEGIIHRDIKPSNIVLSPRGPKLVDLGLARLEGHPLVTQTDTLVGTPAYMDPALLKGRPADAQADLFSLGATLYEALTGRRAFPGESLQEVLRSLVETDPVESLPPDTPVEARRLLSALLQKDPQERPRSAAEALSLLRAPTDVTPPMRRGLGPWGGIGLAVAAMAITVVVGLRVPRWRTPPRMAADQDVPSLIPPTGPAGSYAAHDSSLSPARRIPAEEVPSPISQPRPLPQATAPRLEPGRGDAFGTVWIVTSPWAEVRIDGTVRDTTPLSRAVRLAPGSHTVTLLHPGYPPANRSVSISPGGEETLFVSLHDSVGFLLVETEPWAYLWVDGEHVGPTPLSTPLALRPGRHSLRAENPFFPPLVTEVEVVRAETTRARIALTGEREMQSTRSRRTPP